MLGAHSSSLHLPGGYWIARVSYKKLETGSYPTDAWCPLVLPSPTRWLLDSAGILQETGDWVTLAVSRAHAAVCGGLIQSALTACVNRPRLPHGSYRRPTLPTMDGRYEITSFTNFVWELLGDFRHVLTPPLSSNQYGWRIL
ncbi:hypothetical protein RRG08_013716 [Elysia crispata]|uniref:Uncharacterized protein n=1 Tax=Elysia crispata TaxID=231223 RepID=A0AAE0Z8D6_9GAST|nr:hypothetical protein RRG08_013716 [Elysia crispata]